MTTTQFSELRSLETHLRRCLVAAWPESQHWRVQCAARQGKLVVLVQHAPDAPLNQPRVFGLLEAALRQDAAIQDWMVRSPDLFAVRFYLRRIGEQEPYGFYRVIWEPPSDMATDLALVAPESVAPPPPPLPPPLPARARPAPADGAIAVQVPIGHRLTRMAPRSLEPSVTVLDAVEVVDVVATPVPVRRPWRPWRRIPRFGVAALMSAGILLALGVGYALSRPCVVGQCSSLETAQRLQGAAAQKMTAGQSAQDVVDAYESLMEASYLLNRIPPWSPHYEAAQGMVLAYEANTQKLERVVMAQRLAMQAAVQSQNPPHPLTVWREIQQTWQGAIAQLEKVPQNSSIYDLAQRKLVEYRSNLSQIDQRIRYEVEAQQWITIARKAAQEAETRQGIAQSLDGWKRTRATWESVLSVLHRVPSGTMAHAEARQLLALYQPQLQSAEAHVTLEETSNGSYNRAIALADSAQRSERRDQWGQAVAHWQQALTELNQVQEGSTSYDRVQPLIASYQASLGSAQENLRVSVALQAALRELEPLCGGSPRACTYEQVDTRVQVRMTRAYEEALTQAMARSGLTPVSTTRLNYMNPLLQAIASVGEFSEAPIELYEAQGNLFGIYDPRVDGFVSQLDP